MPRYCVCVSLGKHMCATDACLVKWHGARGALVGWPTTTTTVHRGLATDVLGGQCVTTPREQCRSRASSEGRGLGMRRGGGGLGFATLLLFLFGFYLPCRANRAGGWREGHGVFSPSFAALGRLI